MLGAEVDGELLAAISVDGGELVANPFRPHERAPRPAAGADRLSWRDAAPVRRRRRLRRERQIPERGRRPALGGSPPGEIVSLQRAR